MFGITQSSGVISAINSKNDGSYDIVFTDRQTKDTKTVNIKPNQLITMFYQHGDFKGIEF